ncbi:MAG: two-component regulator propeller domain-containing protein [Bacteroidales bacterium]|nr:two-component regulator propeller domain-containing protein [Bacteroidales bacterium]
MSILHRSTCIYKADRIILVLLFGILIFNGNKLSGQQVPETENLFVTAFTNEDGLRQSMVSRVCQDEKGLIWMVTGDGLHYFDGEQFRAFRVPYNDVYQQQENVMRFLAISKPGELVLSSTSSLLQFNTATAQFKIIYNKSGICPVVFNTLIDGNILVWIRGLNFCLLKDDRLIQLEFKVDSGQKIPAENIPVKVVHSGKNELLICSELGIIDVQLNNRVSDSVFKANWIPLAGCRDVVTILKGKTLVLAGSEILTWQKGSKPELFVETKLKGLQHIFTDSNSSIWLTDQSFNRIYRFADGKIKEIKLSIHIGKSTELLTPSVISIFEDREHNLWFGTDGNGVLMYSPRQVQFQKTNIGFIRCVTAFNNKIWAGTFNNGLWELNTDLSLSKRINPDYFGNRTYFLDLIADKSGRLWIATRTGLEVVNAHGKSIWKYPFQCLRAKFIYQNADSLLLVYDDHLLRLKTSEQPRLYGRNQYISATALLTKGNYYWVGTNDGLYRYGKKQGLVWGINFDSKEYRLSTIPVYSLLLHKDLIWAATGNGIECYNPDGSVHELSACFQSLKNEVIYSILPDNSGRLWITGNNGIVCILPDVARISFFNSKNNLQSLEFNYNASFRNSDGSMYFGGIQGMNYIDPSTFNPDKDAPEVRLISLFVSDTAYSQGIPSTNLDFKLSRMAPHISGKVFSTDYANAGSLLYSFYLEGYQSEWSMPSNNAIFTYRNLPAGEYRLYVKCADTYLNWSKPAKLLSFTISLAFYKTWWFLVLLALSIIGITILAVKRIQLLRYQNQLREIEREFAIEKERLRISKDMHDEVGASLTRISILSELAKKQQNEPAKSLQTINRISEISGGVVDEMSEIIWAMNPRNDTLDSFSSYIRQHASTYLESAEIEGAFLFPDEIPAFHMSSELRRNLFLTVKEAFHNIVKHSGAGNVKMSLCFDKQNLNIKIDDDGKGFEIDKIKGWGNGLTNMRKRIEELDGRFEITSEVGKGTLIELSVTLQQKDKSH